METIKLIFDDTLNFMFFLLIVIGILRAVTKNIQSKDIKTDLNDKI